MILVAGMTEVWRGPPQPSGLRPKVARLARRGMRRGKYMLGYSPITLPIYFAIAPPLLGISDTSKVGFGSRITSETDLVIEGFPRSGNTYCAESFRLISDEHFGVASHVHHVAQVKEAVRREVPTIIVVREPVACLSSYLLSGSHATVRGVLKEYTAYHESLSRIISSCMVVDFSDITSDIDSVIDRANRLFRFDLPHLSKTASIDEVFDVIDSDHRSRYGGAERNLLPRPDVERSNLNAVYRAAIVDPHNSELLGRARDAHRKILALGLDSSKRSSA